jgi:ATP-dependent Clp endopeptidase proteolytic subunit ClpP
MVAAATAFRMPSHPVVLSHAKSMFTGAPMAQQPQASGRVAKVSTSNTGGAGGLVMMPIGVPKVAYRVPGSPSADWVDIYNRLYRERIIFLGQEIDDELANQIIGVMLYLDSEDATKPIYLYINCPGGSVIAGLAIFDTMNHIKSKVVTINVGLSASMASFLLCGGTKGSRLALPNSRVMIHQPMGGAQGQAEDIKVEAAQIIRIKENLVKLYAMMTGQTQDQIIRDLDRDNFMSAQQACDYGIIDKVIPINDN